MNDEYYAFFLTNTLPYLPQAVYRDPEGLTIWTGGIVEFQPSGTLPNNLYFNPDFVYRIEVRHGNLQTDPLIWEINNFVPGGSSSNTQNALLSNGNQIANPQFQLINFISPLTYTQAAPGTYTVDIAPNWVLVLTGAGTTTLSQIAEAGSNQLPGNPPYYLKIVNSGWTTALLRQRFSENGAIFESGAISMTALLRAEGTSQDVSLIYAPSNGLVNNTQVIASTTLPIGAFTVVAGAINLNPSNNSDSGTAAYVDIQIILEGTGTLDITNVQIVGQSVPLDLANFNVLTETPLFKEETIERGLDHLFHYYQPSILAKESPNYLTAWDFALNPAQFLGSTIAASAYGANKSRYMWDQTIVFQSVNSGVAIDRSDEGALEINAAIATQTAIIQYLDQTKARQLLNNLISVNIACFSDTGFPFDMTISLWYTTDASLPSTVGSNNSLVATLDANGKPATFNGTWHEVPRVNGQNAKATVTAFQNPVKTYEFNGWNLNDNALANSATYFAIVIGTSTIPLGKTWYIKSVNVAQGNIASLPAAQTADQVWRECLYYYEKSYNNLVIPGAISNNSQRACLMSVQNAYNGANYFKIIGAGAFEFEFDGLKRIAPVIAFYSPSAGTLASVDAYLYSDGSNVPIYSGVVVFADHWVNLALGTKATQYIPAGSPLLFQSGASAFGEGLTGFINFHYTADSRLGI